MSEVGRILGNFLTKYSQSADGRVRVKKAYYDSPRSRVPGKSIDSKEVQELDDMISQRYPNAPKKYAVYKNVIDGGDSFNVMRVLHEGDKKEDSVVTSLTYGAGHIWAGSRDERPTEDLKFFDSKEKAQKWLIKRAANYQKPKGKTGGNVFHQWNELNKKIENASYLTPEEKKQRQDRIWSAYKRYSDNIRKANRGKSDPDTKYVSREKYMK